MTYSEFYNRISDLPEKFENRDLEDYLSALYLLVEKGKNDEASAQQVLGLIEDAFTAAPVQFKKEWLAVKHPPHTDILSRKFTNPELTNTLDKSKTSRITGVEFTLGVLRFQIAELHKMRGKQLSNELRYSGIDSETGNRWYNFDPVANLECGARCLLDNVNADDDEMPVTHQTLGEILEMGRIYE